MCTSGTRSHRVRGQRYSGLEACKIERDIENFVENFKKKESYLDSPRAIQRPPSLESCSSSQSRSSRPSSSMYSSDLTDESPEKSTYLLPEIVRRYRYCSTTTTSDSEGGEEDFRRLLLAYKDSKAHSNATNNPRDSVGTTGTVGSTARSSITEGPDYIPGDAMGMEACPYSVLDVAQLLQSKFAFISGAKAKNGAPIMTFPDRPNLPDPNDEDYRKVVTYLCSIPAMDETHMGFVLLVDRRQSGWGSVKTILMRFSGFFPSHIQVVFLLQPHGFFQRAFSDYRSKFKEDLEYKVVSIDDPEEMFDYVERENVTVDMGGQLDFDADEWTQNRAAVEKFNSNTEKIAVALTTLVKKFEQACTPNDVDSTERQIHEHTAHRRELLEDLESATFHGQTLLSCIKGNNNRTPTIQIAHVLEVEKMIMQLEETKKHFDEYWDKHLKKLQQSLQLRQFEDNFKLFQFNADKDIEWLESKMKDIGDSVKKVDELIAQLDEFEEKAKRALDEGEKMRANGEQYIMDDHYAVDSIRPKCIELQRMCNQYSELLRKRRDILNKSRDLQERIEKANKWCTNGVDMLASQQLEGYSAPNSVANAIQEIDKFVVTAKDLRLNNPKEFRQLFESMITSDTRASVQKVLKKVEDVQAMCAKRKADLQAQSRSPPVQHPVHPDEVTRSSRGQTTVPEYDLKKKHGGHRDRDRERDRQQHRQGHESPKRINPSMEKSARQVRPDTGHPHSRSGQEKGHPLPQSRSGQEISNHPPRSRSGQEISHPQPNPRLGHHGSTSTNSSGASTGRDIMDGQPRNSLASTTSGSSTFSDQILDGLNEKKRHVLNELIETETTYVHQLHDILRGYFCEMDNRAMQHLIPDEILMRKDILFGNLEQIYRFHHDVFLKDLQSCKENPGKLGKCFVNRKDEFQMYSIYCQNKPRSEELRSEVGDNNPFFKECQRKLGHKLPLGAYLLKPVQRITKYQLLLKEMLKFTKDDRTCQQQLEDALSTMLEVLRIVNNSMYQVSITGYTGNLSELGKLLMQGKFHVWTEHKHEKIRDIRFKAMQRHLFLYEKAILMCKQKEDTQNGDKDIFCFKNMLRCNQVGLTENIRGDKRKFELWLRGREEVYIVQPSYLQKFIAIADYDPIDDVEMGLREGDVVEILRTGSTGWWMAHHLTTNEEGWVPATYLDPLNHKGSRSMVSVSSIGSGSQVDQTSRSSLTSGYSATSPVDETTI